MDPTSSIWGQAPGRCPGSAVPLLSMEKMKEKGELLMDTGKSPCAEAWKRTSPARKKRREKSKQTNPRRKRLGRRRSYGVLVWGPELSHVPVKNARPPRAVVMCKPYFGKLRQGQPQLLSKPMPVSGGAPRATSCRCWRRRLTETLLSWRGVGRMPACAGAGAGRRNTSHVSQTWCRDKKQPHPQ